MRAEGSARVAIEPDADGVDGRVEGSTEVAGLRSFAPDAPVYGFDRRQRLFWFAGQGGSETDRPRRRQLARPCARPPGPIRCGGHRPD